MSTILEEFFTLTELILKKKGKPNVTAKNTIYLCAGSRFSAISELKHLDQEDYKMIGFWQGPFQYISSLFNFERLIRYKAASLNGPSSGDQRSTIWYFPFFTPSIIHWAPSFP